MHIEFVLYTSVERRALGEDTTIDIICKSVENNRRDWLTGFLHHQDGSFLQYLEGPPGPLHRRIQIIQKDRRHKGLRILAEGDAEDRLFPDWDMGLIDHDCLKNAPWMRRRFWMNEAVDGQALLRAFAGQAGALSRMDITEAS